jgi:hypothetical protein
MNNEMKLTFLTTSTFSDVQETQSKCINKYFPNSEHILIDGRGGWFSIWYKWLEIAKEIDSDWFIHIDEDCFITSNEEIEKTIIDMENGGYDIAGPPDGYYEYRGANPTAFNSFFMIVSKKCIETWFSKSEKIPQFKEEWIEEYLFEKKGGCNYDYDMEFGSSGKPVNLIWKPNTEPYYDLFWVLKENNLKFKYLEPIFNDEFQTTNLLNNSIIHMWYQRQRFSNYIVSPIHKMPNRIRYDGMINKIKKLIN